jgi:hypothetical protein
MATELAFTASGEVDPLGSTDLGLVLVRPYERIRLLAFCPADASGPVEVSLVHVVGESAAGTLDRVLLLPGTELNRVYELPGEVLGIVARATTDAPTGVTAYIWGHRTGDGAGPSAAGPGQGVEEGMLEVSAVLVDPVGGLLQPLGAGVLVRVDGTRAGFTDDNGILTVTSAAGSHEVEALLPSMGRGTTTVEVTAGATTAVTVSVVEGAGTTEPCVMTIDELINGALPLSVTSVTVRFRRGLAPDEEPVSVTEVSRVELYNVGVSAGGGITDLLVYFTAGSGAVIAEGADAAQVIAIVGALSTDARLLVHAADADGLGYEGEIEFGIGVYRIEGQLVGPPSRPDLAVEGVSVTVEANDFTMVEATSDAAGRFVLADLPGGMVVVSTSVIEDETVYTATAGITLDADKSLLLRPLTTADLQAGVEEYEVSDLPVPPAPPLSPGLQSPRRPAPVRLEGMTGEPVVARTVGPATRAEPAADADGDKVTVSVTAAAEDQPVRDQQSLTVPQGTQSVVLQYEVSTEEYPHYVLQQSRFNDMWDVRVVAAPGTVLFQVIRRINSQLYGRPAWNASGSTGTVQERLDVSDLASAGDIELTVRATAKNVGDDLLPTTVTATLGAEPQFLIRHVEQDTGPHSFNRLFSIPRSGETNVFQRSVLVTYDKPEDIDLDQVRVELLGGSGGPEQTVLEEDADGVHITHLSDTQLAAQVTFSPGTTTSTVDSIPPPFDDIGYRVTLRGLDEDGNPVDTEPKDATGLVALWRMPDGLPRYSTRELGGDDWSRQFTYAWLDGHRQIVTAINDISKEHGGVFDPHDSHRFGYDMDLFHPLPVLATGSGTQNYLRVVALARLAIQGNPQAIAQLGGWVAYTRQWLDTMLDDPDVIKIGYMKGAQDMFSSATHLRGGWAQELLFTGAYAGPLPAGGSIQLGLGLWPNASDPKLFFDDEHNNHVHVRLRSG